MPGYRTSRWLKGSTSAMTNTPGMTPQSGLLTRHAIATSSAFTRVFGNVRPFLLRQELPRDVLKGVSGHSPLHVQLLHNRGISGMEAIGTFLAGDWRSCGPAPLHLARAVERIRHAIRDGEHIVVFGDFDCDGVTSCVLLTQTLGALGANITQHVPQRDDDGRGLNIEAVRQLAERGASLIVTTDCGTANVAEVELAGSLGMDVIITDHHPPHGPLAPAYAIVNPRQDGDESPEKDLAGVGVAFRLAEALLAGTPAGEELLPQLVDLVAIGTVADVVPLTQTNWALVRAGLAQITAAPRAGVRALLEMARLRPGDVVVRDVSFALAPRINACGRMGRPDLAVALLLANDPAEAERLAREVEALNVQRQSVTEGVVIAAREQAAAQLATNMSVVITQGDHWPLGVLGLVAGRLADEYHRPAFVISREGLECRGSARGPSGTDLGEVLAARADFFTRFGGHAQAAGFTLPTDALPALLAYLTEHFSGQEKTSAETEDGDERRDAAPVAVDCRLPLRRLEPGSDVYADLEALEPFGVGFAEPVFLCPGARIMSCRRSGLNGRTLRLRLGHGGTIRELVWSRQGDLCEPLRAALNDLPLVDVAYTLRRYSRATTGVPEWLPHIETLAPAGS